MEGKLNDHHDHKISTQNSIKNVGYQALNFEKSKLLIYFSLLISHLDFHAHKLSHS